MPDFEVSDKQPDEQDASVNSDLKAQEEQKQLTRRQAIRRLGYTTGMTAFGLLAMDDLTRLAGDGLTKSGNPLAIGVGEELQNEGAAFAQFAYDPGTTSPPGTGPGPVSCPLAAVPLMSGHMNTLNGNFHMSQPLAGWGGPGNGLNMGLSYNSQSDTGSAFGPSWTHSFSSNVSSPDSNGVTTVTHDDGTEDGYTSATGTFAPPNGVYDQLLKNADGSYLLTKSGGTQYRYTPAGKLSSVMDLNGNVTRCSYSNGLLSQVTDPTGRSLSFSYSGSSVSSVTDCVGRTWQFAYSGGLLTSIVDPINNGVSASQSFAYDSFNNLTGHTDRFRKTWGYSYDSLGGMTQSIDPDGNTSNHQAANTSSTPVDATWPSAVLGIGSSTDPNGNKTQYGYGAQLCLLAERDALGKQITYTYDNNNNRVTTRLPSGATWTNGYDAAGNLTSQTDPLGNKTQISYNGYGQATSVTDPSGNISQQTYDSNGNLLSATDSLNNTAYYTYTGNMMTQFTDSTGNITKFAYDAHGNQTGISDPQGNTTQYVYSADGLLCQRTDSVGRITNYNYDTLGRPTNIQYPTTGHASVSYTYDAAGRIIQSVDGTGTRNFSYDSGGRKIGMTDPMGNTVASYDKAGRIVSQTDVSGRTLSYAYDPTARLTSVDDATEAVQYTYTDNGQPLVAKYPNGIQTAYGYDTLGRVTGLTHTIAATGAIVVAYAAQYDKAGNLAQVTEQPSGDVTTYTYDSVGQLLTEQRAGQQSYSGTYRYDALGNRVSARVVTGGQTTQDATYTYDGMGRLNQVNDAISGVENYTWNVDGTLASLPRPGYIALMSYDEEARLTEIHHNTNGVVTLAYQYGYGADGGQRWRKDYSNNEWVWYPCGVACCAGSLVEKQSDLTGSSWTTSAQYLRGNGLVGRNGEYHLPDINGVNAVITSTTGAVLSSNVYDKFGVQQAVQGSAMTPFRYGQQADEATIRQGSMSYIPSISAHGVKRPQPPKAPRPPDKPCRPLPTMPPSRNCTTDLNQCEMQPAAIYQAELAAIAVLTAALIQKCNAFFRLDKRANTICIAAVATAAAASIVASFIEEQQAFGRCRAIYEQCIKVPGNKA